MTGLGRNDVCWCGSGKKYKKCHLDRELQEKANPWEAVAINKKAFSSKKCFAKNIGFGDCEGKIVKAHTVSRGPNLAKIARNGKVICYDVDPAQLKRNGGRIEAIEIGISDASVFYGFCSEHDRTLFSCIENEIFTGRADQCLAVAYRTLSRELYSKNAGSHIRETLRIADKGKSLPEQIQLQEILNMIEIGNSAAIKEVSNTHEKLTAAMIGRKFEELHSAIIEFEGLLPFMVSGAWTPFTDFYGEELQDGLSDQLLEQIFISSFAGIDCSRICISWMNRLNAPGRIIADQICSLPKDQQASACLQISAKHLENIFYSPDWFHLLKDADRIQLYTLVCSGLDVTGSVPNAKINLKFNFSLPENCRTLNPTQD